MTERVRETVEASVETVEIEEFQCPNCGQWFEEDGLVDVGIGFDGGGDDDRWSPDVDHATHLCKGCCDIVFGYEPPDSAAGLVLEAARLSGWRSVAAAGASLFGVLLGIAAIAHGLGAVWAALVYLPATVEESAFADAFFSMAPLAFSSVIVLWVVAHLPGGGGHR